MARARVLPVALFGAGVVLALSTTFLAYHRVGRLIDDEDQVIHTRQVLGEIESLRRFLARAEASQRGWLLTSDPVFREKRDLAVGELRSTVSVLRGLTADNPDQQARVEAVAPLVERRATALVAPPPDHSSDPAILRDFIRDGGRLTDQILVIAKAMEEAEKTLLDARSSSARRSARHTLLATVMSGATSIIAFGLGIGAYVRENRRRQQAEEAAQTANARLEAANRELKAAGLELERVFNNSLDLICVADLDGTFKKLNPSWQRVLGWPIEELLAHPWLHFVHPDDREATVKAGEQLGAGAPVIQFENRYCCRDGSYRWLSWKTPAPAPGSTTLYGTARDVTDLKAAEERILALNKELEAFSYSVSHDLRAPLRHANGFIELLQKHLASSLDEKGRHYLATISAAAKKMGRLIDDLLAFSRVGRVELKRAGVVMSGMVEEIRRDLEAEARGRTIAWDVKPLPEANGDAALLRQVWVNLLSNAVKYTKNRPDARIEVGVIEMNGQGPAYYVRDNGAGFDMTYSDKLFGVFQRLHSAQEFEGTGIGLANVKRIVTRHGGRIWAESTVGEGATFYFTLPMGGKEG